MPAFSDFQKEVNSGKVKNVYFIMASDNYFIRKAGEILREKLFGSKDNKDNFFLRYGDENSTGEIIDLCSNFSSLFSASKIVVLKRTEKLYKKLDELLDYSKKPDTDTTLLICFDKDYVLEKKLTKEIAGFYDFSELPEKDRLNWIRSEFESRNTKIEDNALELFVSLVPDSFELTVNEIEKICTFSIGESSGVVTKDIILKFTGYSSEYSPDQLMYAIVKKESGKALEILDYLLNKGGVNEIFLLSTLTNYYMDLISFKTKGFSSNDSYSHFGKYKMWGDRLKFAKTFHNLLDIGKLRYSLLRLLETDLKLKTSMLDSKILLASLVQDLVSS